MPAALDEVAGGIDPAEAEDEAAPVAAGEAEAQGSEGIGGDEAAEGAVDGRAAGGGGRIDGEPLVVPGELLLEGFEGDAGVDGDGHVADGMVEDLVEAEGGDGLEGARTGAVSKRAGREGVAAGDA